ncbi:FAD-binding oxidoreductase [Planosporangium flavigriseum]|uniref:Alkyldihydroxyacetonephosphate synthase n=2 Tax=Planosporangium flavigriseum TaxID=373681 RepID=A0A8J3M029_9ACTN|nr:FAD-binding oxidoreductase [Planosporangium flavigriseum]NJC67974.1 FAD-binding oxidoreductase [Planosporangium flavigriseum]GIG76626.1 alkyldihydroxyacetonephosphate synthase [Planosporangium flavigriseum]
MSAAHRWGDPSRAVTLPDGVRTLLASALGVREPHPPASVAALPPPGLSDRALRALEAACSQVRTDDQARLAHAAGMSTVDLLRLRAGDAADAPDAVIAPADHDEVTDVLAACAAHRIAVVTFGGGTSVVGGLRASRDGYAGVVAVDLARLGRLRHLDPVSRTATFEAGVRAPRAEELLAEQGFTLGHFPQSFERATIGGFAATRSSGQASSGYGRFDQMVVGLRVATPSGTLHLGRAPHTAAGPDLRQLFLGSEGALGVITEVTVQIRPTPPARRYLGWRLADFAAATEAARALAQDGPLPAVLRCSDELETTVNAVSEGASADGCLMITGIEGTEDEVAGVASALTERLAGLGGQPLGEEPGQAWLRGRFAAPYLRDALLDAGALVETVETAAFWSALPATYAAVRDALATSLAGQGTPPLVLCHISHVYSSGASLYFTVVAAQADDPVAQWQAAKAAAGDAIAASGATITHHHGVGRDHIPWYRDEIGHEGVAVLRAVKRALDPEGVLNPGVLLP